MSSRTAFLAGITFALAACKGAPVREQPVPPSTDTPEAAGPTVAEAKAFMAEVDAQLRATWTKRDLADWDRATNITPETEALASKASEEAMAYLTQAIRDARRFEPVVDKLDPETARMFHLLRLAGQPAPEDAAHATELSQVMTEMDSTYAKGKVCDAKQKCKKLGDLEDILAQSRDPKALLAAWQGWHDNTGRAVRPYYERFVPLANEGAKSAGFANVRDMWLSRYDMTPDAMVAEADRLWDQVAPLYSDLHCYTRRKLAKKYRGVVGATAPLPAHLLGNMWAQAWGNIYPLVEPYPGQLSPDVSKELVKQKYDAQRMTKLAESFFTSLGLKPLPATFWERSMFVQPEGREVVCHASAWDPTYSGDARIKMCTKVNQDDLITLHHELGHDYYYLYYHQLPMLFQDGANDGFHEAIGDTIALSVTPTYLNKVGLLKKVPNNEKAVINQQMFVALEKIAFLPFGLVVDKWRWEAFSGAITPEQWNDRWWELRRKYQGIEPAVKRAATDFDPGAKYHVPGNTPYLRYFLSTILQFQFHRALCEAAGWKGPLHECSIHGSAEAGARFAAMLSLGSSKPWADALEALTGQRTIDASAILDYFGPLHAWLKEQNKGQTCGW